MIITLDLVKSYADKLLIVRWVQLCPPLVAELFLFCFERYFMTSLSDDNQADIIEVFNSTSRYLDDLLKINNGRLRECHNKIT